MFRRNLLFVFISGQGSQPDGPTCSALIAPFAVSLTISSMAILEKLTSELCLLKRYTFVELYLVKTSSFADCTVRVFLVSSLFCSVFGFLFALAAFLLNLIENLSLFELVVDIFLHFVYDILLLRCILKPSTFCTYIYQEVKTLQSS